MKSTGKSQSALNGQKRKRFSGQNNPADHQAKRGDEYQKIYSDLQNADACIAPLD